MARACTDVTNNRVREAHRQWRRLLRLARPSTPQERTGDLRERRARDSPRLDRAQRKLQ